MKKFIAEFIGTFVLVLIGTGTVVLGGGIKGIGILGIAAAFGFSIMAMVYTIGNISGCHINPAVSIAMFINKRLSGKDLIGYIIAQVLGGIFASFMLMLFLKSDKMPLNNFGQDGVHNLTIGGALLVEIVLTFIFVLVIMAVTGKKGNPQFAGLAIGIALLSVHLVGVPLTGTSVNPARSIGPALFAGGEALSHLWIFIVAPIIGGIIAALVAKYVLGSEEEA
ncbi:MAG: MIP/aquaporin family protein [Clostridium sp.]|uniref:MIP/aquaporin family protein n=1 Tax=Clostridium sp. TaxID=1506 RepID=UPI003EE757E6